MSAPGKVVAHCLSRRSVRRQTPCDRNLGPRLPRRSPGPVFRVCPHTRESQRPATTVQSGVIEGCPVPCRIWRFYLGPSLRRSYHRDTYKYDSLREYRLRRSRPDRPIRSTEPESVNGHDTIRLPAPPADWSPDHVFRRLTDPRPDPTLHSTPRTLNEKARTIGEHFFREGTPVINNEPNRDGPTATRSVLPIFPAGLG